ncbi:MAG: rhodanese-like domain-containing protein [Planctomycetota bacterium]
MPISSLAVTQATFAGLPAQLQTGPKGMVLMLPGEASGKLELHAVTKPEYLGRRGSAAFSLPPLPAAVMTVVLPEADLELEVERIEAAPAKRIVNGSVEYTFGLGMVRTLTLRWLPKTTGSAADRTLSANAQHDVYAFHWATVGVSKVTYSFSSGQYDRFALLMPQGTTLTELEGTNVRDFRDVGESAALPDEGKPFRLIEVRLHRPAQKQYELTVRWLSPHPDGGGFDLDDPAELPLIRAGAVSRESGTVTLHAAGGMSVKVTKVTGGRRADIAAGNESQGIDLPADRARPVARYYWPYRPFALFVELSRLAVTPKVRLNQLVRINTDRVELLVQANLKAEQGKLFGAGFILPEGYELLSAVGPAVADFYERSSEEGKFVHIMFHGCQTETQFALMLLREEAELDSFDVPAVMYLDEPGRPLAGQQGRIAVQVAASLEAETAASQNLKSISPATLRDWLDEKTVNSVQFAHRYEAANPSLQLTIRRLPTTIRAEVFAGLVVRATVAAYTYRLRYNIAGSPVDHLSFLLPSEYARLVSVESRALRSVTQSDAGNGRTRWTVALVNEVTGIVDVVVNFALPIDPSTAALQIPPLAAETASEYRAVVALQNMSRHEISVRDRTNLSDLAASEQQRLMPRQMRESLQHVFQSFEEDWSLSLEFKPAKTATRIQAVVDLLEVTTVVDRGGQCRYEAKVALQNRSEQFLQVKVPPGLRLWSANVAGQPVKPVMVEDSSEGNVLIPLVKTSPGGLPYDVYFYLADDGAAPLVTPLNGMTRLKPPSLSIVGIPVMQTTWSLRLPGGYRYMRPGGNMSPVAGTIEVLSLGIEAKLEQLRRLERTYREVAGSSVRREKIAKSMGSVQQETFR